RPAAARRLAGRAGHHAVHGRPPAVHPDRTARGDRRRARIPGPDAAREPRLRGPRRAGPLPAAPPRPTGRAGRRGGMLGAWLFALEAFGKAAPDADDAFLDDFVRALRHLGGSPGAVRERLRRVRHEDVPAYLDALVDGFPWADFRVVGFSSTFQQNTASFALARRLKQRWPELVTVFGGANFDGDMGPEWVRAVDAVDLAVIGEGDSAFPGRLAALAAGSDPVQVPGVARRVGDRVVAPPPAPPAQRLDDLPAPDYTEFFARAEDLGVLPRTAQRQVRIPFESARGCWWGAKHHCTFCGLNGA